MPASPFACLLFGRAEFHESEEYLAFQFKLLAIVLVSGALFTALFLLGEFSRINPLSGSPHLYSMSAFTAAALILWGLLRGHKERFLWIAWSYECACLLEYVSALAFVPQDELRVLWFFTNIPGVYILLGQRAGAAITTLSVVGLAFGNASLSAPYSPNGLATLIVALVYQGVFFHIYGNRSLSYFARMRASHEKLHHMATHDTLTGVMNARAYYSACEQMILLGRRHGTPFSVLFVDLDHFKSVNDMHGHAAGDAVLKAVAGALRTSIRTSDALGRVGGEEFSIFLPDTDLLGALQLAETIRRGIEQLMPVIESGPLRISASIGVAECSDRGQSMQEIQRQADAAMYAAKQQGRNRVSTLSPQKSVVEPAGAIAL
ncbi:GGDEF domain-containing protein [Rhodocyclus tenuis]|uniref:GGDEF domain-containing protein n=1 Tax=Rhodocyclus tenuis TaxID=1066 RepID=UPI001905687A|nr:GGDEF domain-containing protein [Rhodocyclus tenuis]MBK1681464.1 hypothetical protein [Rhodocyclus tenuis]